MKKLVIIFSLFFVATSLFSQQDPALWKANPEKLKGAKIIINAEKAPNNSSSFFIDNPNLTKYGSRYFNARRKGARASFQVAKIRLFATSSQPLVKAVHNYLI